MQSSYLGTQAVEVSPSGASGAGQQNWCSTVWFLCEKKKITEKMIKGIFMIKAEICILVSCDVVFSRPASLGTDH